MRTLTSPLLIFICLCFSAVFISAEDAAEPQKFRTDDNPDTSLPWFEPVDGEFPPEEYARYFAGELIGLDHIDRTLKLRVDRQDDRAGQDEAIDVVMLPYGSIYFRNAPADLRDIPLGTHLHGWFYIRPVAERFWETRNGKLQRKNGMNGNASGEVDFTRCFRLEDDFSFYARKEQIWRVDKIEPSVPVKEGDYTDLSLPIVEKKLTATLLNKDGKPSGQPKVFDLMESTMVYRDNGFGAIEDIAPGQFVQLNLTWATLFGPGRVTDIWLDDESRAVTTSQQLKRHHRHIRERGIPGYVSEVNDKERLISIAFFDSVDEALYKELDKPNPKALGWPTKEYDWGNVAPKGNIIVVRESLMCYNQVNDRKGGNIQKIVHGSAQPGSSGVVVQVKVGIVLEGFRPGKVVRFFPATWAVNPLPKEEEFHGRE